MSAGVRRIPAGWIAGALGEFIKPRGEKASPVRFPDVPFIGMDNVESNTTRILGTIPARQLKSNAARFYAGDVLYGRLRPYLNKVVRPSFDGLASAEFLVFPDSELIRACFLKYRLNAADFVGFSSHLNEGDRPRVDFAQLAKFPLLVPPPREQLRIVAKLEELLAEIQSGVNSLAAASEQLKTYRQSVLKHAFDDKLCAANADVWPHKRLASVSDLVTSGSRGWAAHYSQSGDLFIRAQNLKHDRLTLDDVAYVCLPKVRNAEAVRSRAQVGDVLVTITGANVTKTGLVEHELGTAYVNQHVALVRPTDAMLPEFLYWYLVAEAGGRRQLVAAAYGAGKPGLSLDNIKSVIIPLPDRSVQLEVVREIRSRLSITERVTSELNEAFARARALRESILRLAFQGRLVRQDLSDEPANAVAARLRADAVERQHRPRNRKGKNAA